MPQGKFAKISYVFKSKKNKSGSTSIHIVDRTNRGYKLIESLGSSKKEDEIEDLYQKALCKIDEIEKNLLHTSKINNKKEQLLDLLSLVTSDIYQENATLIYFTNSIKPLYCL